MSAGLQKTLFQTWGGSLLRNGVRNAPRGQNARGNSNSGARCSESCAATRLWIYPTNYPVREYQLKMSEAALFRNTLVCLPTGLGKTFIASVVMYNFYRWYPSGKIVFMAPTKPLVAQQIEACFRVMGIPQEHMAELTGSTQANSRRDLWRSRRVFFLTPQVMVNDLSRQTCPADQVKCVVIDEAHKALGNHAYCQVVKELANQPRQFRVLALSATPGADVKAVQQVISNLLISHIELRSEESPDIQVHSHERSLEKIVVPLGDSLATYQARYLQVLEKFTGRLTQMGVLPKRDLRSLTKYQLILAREQFRNNPHPHIVGCQQGALEGDFALCITLYHGYELLLQMGLRSLFLFTQGIMDGTKEMARARNELHRTKAFMDLYQELEAMFSKCNAESDGPFVCGHPKLQKLEEVVLQHFKTWSQSTGNCRMAIAYKVGPSSGDTRTRVMIFSSFRESVQEIAIMLHRHAPLIRVMTFMGQASAGKGVRGFTQKEQLEVVRRFRDGGFNTLVSTCVGEEGLDIGEVDLIVCFDAQKSPIRLVQRMGRTGRQRQGRIVVILAEGREERTYNQSQSNKRSVYKSIMRNQHAFHMYPNSPRMLPDWAQPTLHKMFITCGQFEHQKTGRQSSRRWRAGATPHEALLHCSSLGGRLDSVKEDGFLTPSEFSIWASTMRLGEEEPQPTLSHSYFLSIKSDAPPKERGGGLQVRELSLGDWWCWQNRPFPTYRIEHSDRCRHFTEIMAFLDSMRQEEESCSYESRLMQYLHREDVVGFDGGEQLDKVTKKTVRADGQKDPSAEVVCEKNGQNFYSRSAFLAKEEDGDFVVQSGGPTECTILTGTLKPLWTTIKKTFPLENNEGVNHKSKGEDLPYVAASLAMDIDIDLNPGCTVIPNESGKVRSLVLKKSLLCSEPNGLHPLSKLNSSGYGNLHNDYPCKIESLFYLPDWGALQKTLSPRGTPQNVNSVFDNVMELLSRSPPEDFDIEGSVYEGRDARRAQSPEAHSKTQEGGDQFQVNFLIEGAVSHEESPDSILSGRYVEELSWDCGNDGKLPMYVEAKPEDLSEVDTGCATESLAWEEAFDYDNDVSDHVKLVALQASPAEKEDTNSNESMDLFEDDDDMFLQASIYDHSLAIEEPKKQSPGDCMEVSGCLVSNATRTENLEENKGLNNPSWTHYSASPEDGNIDCSQQLFSVNFDLGYSIESDEEDPSGAEKPTDTATPRNSSIVTPRKNMKSFTISQNFCNSTRPRSLANRKGERQPRVALETPTFSPYERQCHDVGPAPLVSTSSPLIVTPRKPANPVRKTEFCESWSYTVAKKMGRPFSKETWATTLAEPCNSDSDEEMLVQRRRRRVNNPLASPEASSSSTLGITFHFFSTVSEESVEETVSDDDFQDTFMKRPKAPCCRRHPIPQRRAEGAASLRKQFLDEEAALSEQDCSISTDEAEDNESEGSLDGFVIDTSCSSQGLNDSEMHGVYLKSVKSPATMNKYKMVYKPTHCLDVFSQVPEQDETYKEDSFVVQSSDVEELESGEGEEEVVEEVELLPEESFIGDRRVYPTRRRAKLRQAQVEDGHKQVNSKGSLKPKRSRIIHIDDSSEEDDEGKRKKRTGEDFPGPCKSLDKLGEQQLKTSQGVPSVGLGKIVPGPKELEERCHQRLNLLCSVSEAMDILPSASTSALVQPAGSKASCSDNFLNQNTEVPPVGGAMAVSVLVDSRCVASSAELVSCLRLRHRVTVQVCSLNNCHFIVSNRMAVERQPQSEVASSLNRRRLADRIRGLQILFDRVCLILEKDRIRPGDALRPFQQSRYYDSTLALLIQAGVRLLFSEGPQETAALLAELAHLEQRKSQAITVPTELTAPWEHALQFYLTLPCVSYVTALNMCRGFRSVGHLVDSSVETLMHRACVTRCRAMEIYRYLHYPCDPNMLPGRRHSP
ncbi:Fanconi anemia group M protein [Arapaima gigas]